MQHLGGVIAVSSKLRKMSLGYLKLFHRFYCSDSGNFSCRSDTW